MSMEAVFIQVMPDELARIEKVPALAESLFQPGVASPLAAFGDLSKKMEDRIRAAGPQLLGQALSNLDPRIRQQLEQRMGATAAQFASGQGGDQLLKIMKERRERALAMSSTSQKDSPKLSLDKNWHGVHYLLCGRPEPGETVSSQAVLGGKPLGDDDEGFSGYGPARYFSAAEVRTLSEALSDTQLESEAEARFDPAKMKELEIYPGFRPQDLEPLLDSLRQLRTFYADAATKGSAIVTCLV